MGCKQIEAKKMNAKAGRKKRAANKPRKLFFGAKPRE